MDRSSYYNIRDDDNSDHFDVRIENGVFSFSLSGDNQNHLTDVTLTAKRGSFVGIIGRVGSGKSALLQAILGEMDRRAGRIFLKDIGDNGVAYVQQEPWLQQVLEIEWVVSRLICIPEGHVYARVF